MVEHKWFTPECTQGEDCPGCMWCAGGLESCSVCNAFEGATPDECPGEPMTEFQSDSVYNGTMNYRNGEWLLECCKVMRPVHDTEKFMEEQGYYKTESGQFKPISELS